MLVNIILILLVLGFVGAGWKDGAIQTAGRVIGAVLGFILARSWSMSVAFIFQILLPASWARLAAFLVIFGFVTRLVGFVFKIAEGVFKIISIIPFIKSINSLLGAIAGLIEGIVFLGGAIWIVQNFSLFPTFATTLSSSAIASTIRVIFEFLLHFVL